MTELTVCTVDDLWLYGTESLLVGLSTIPTVAQIVALYMSTFTVLSKVLSKYFGSFYDLPEIKLAEASIFLLTDFSQISKKR